MSVGAEHPESLDDSADAPPTGSEHATRSSRSLERLSRKALKRLMDSERAGRLITRLVGPWVRESSRLTYLALGEVTRIHEGAATPATSAGQPLTRFERRVFSQNGEDGVLAELLRRVGAGSRWFVEFGTENGAEGNCVFLADVLGWPGLFIEGDECSYAALERRYSGNASVHTQRAVVSPDNVEELFARAGVPPEPAVLSIDVDGNDYWIWRAITSYSPRIVVIEYNSHWPLHRRWVQRYDPQRVWQADDYYGASLAAMRSLGEEKGYRLVHTELAGLNAFFVRTDLAGGLPEGDAVPQRAPNLHLKGGFHTTNPAPPPIIDLDA